MEADGKIVISTKLDNSALRPGTNEFNSAVNSMKKSVNTVYKQMSGSGNGYIKSVKRSASETRQASKQMEANLKALEDQAKRFRAALSGHKAETNDFKQIEQDIRKGEDALNRLIAKRQKMRELGTDKDSRSWKALEYEIDQTGAHLDRLSAKRDAMLKDGTAYIKATDSSDYQKVVDQLNDVEAKLKQARAKKEELFKPAESGAAQEQGMSRLAAGAQAVRESFSRMISVVAKAGASIAKLAGHGAVTFLKKVASSAKNAAIQLAKLSGKAISGGLKGLGGLIGKTTGALGKLFTSSKKSDTGFKSGLKTLLKYGLGVRSLFFLYRKLRQSVIDNMGAMAKKNPELQKSLNGFTKALNTLKGSLASAFAPIVSVVAPALTTLINMLTSAINTIGMFIALLTGQKAYQAAVGGLEATGSAASGAAGSVKELKRQLAGFDELEVLSENQSGGGGGGGGGSGTGVSYVTQSIEGGLVAFVDNIKELFAAGQFEAIGAIIADGINSAFEKAKNLISWDSLGDKVTEAVQAITGIFNGLVDGIDWPLIGQTFGEGLNTLIYTWNALFDGTRFYNLGQGITEALNNMILTIDEVELGRAFTQKLNAVLKAALAFVRTFEWGEAGKKFGNAVYSLLSNVEWDVMGEDIAGLINGAFTALKNAVTAFSWGDAATKFATTVNGIIGKVDWVGLGDTLREMLARTVATLKYTSFHFEWGTAGKNLADAINELFKGEKAKQMWADVGKTFNSALNGALDFTINLAQNFDSDAFERDLEIALSQVEWPDLADKALTLIFAGGSFVIKLSLAILDGIKQAIADIPWGDLGERVRNWLENDVPWGEIIDTVFGLIRVAFIGLGDFIVGLLGDIIPGLSEKWESVRPQKEKLPGAGNNGSREANWTWRIVNDRGEYVNTSPIKDLKEAIAGNSKATKDQTHATERAMVEADKRAGSYDYEHDPNKRIAVDLGKDLVPVIPSDAVKKELKNADWLSDFDKALLGFENEKWPNVQRETGEGFFGGISKWIQDEQIGAVAGKVLDKAVETGRPEMVDALRDLLPEDLNEKWADDLSATYEKAEAVQKEQNKALANNTEALEALSGNGLDKGNLKLASDLGGNLQPKISATVEFSPEGIANGAFKNGGLIRYLQTIFDPGVDAQTRIELIRNGWTSLINFVGTNNILTAIIALAKSGWSLLSRFIGTDNPLSALIKLVRDGWSSAGGFIGILSTLFAKLGLSKDGWSTAGGFIGILSTLFAKLGLSKDGWSTVGGFIGILSTLFAKIGLSQGWAGTFLNWLTGDKNGKVGITLTLDKIGSSLKGVLSKIGINLATGGIITAGGVVKRFANGGTIMNSGRSSWWNGVQKYASGTGRAHGTLFVAGEAGPEVVGHVGGRTEVLNKSQLAQTMKASVTAGMVEAMRGITFKMPAMAMGVMPYEVSAQIARTGMEIQSTMNANNEDLIQTIISVAGQIVAAVQAIESAGNNAGRGATAQDVINEINRRTQMFGTSPLAGV